MKDKRNLFQRIFGYCPGCGEWFNRDIKVRRRNTQYCDEESNYLLSRHDCYTEDSDYWAMRWEDYYSGLL
jgi:hypothetical protein